MRKPKRATVRGPVRPGTTVPREAPMDGKPWPKQFRYYNPDGEAFEMELDLSPWVQCLLRDGEIEVVEQRTVEPRTVEPRTATPASKTDDKPRPARSRAADQE